MGNLKKDLEAEIERLERKVNELEEAFRNKYDSAERWEKTATDLSELADGIQKDNEILMKQNGKLNLELEKLGGDK